MAQENNQTAGKIELKREMGLFSAVSIILAVMIGKTQLLTENLNFHEYISPKMTWYH
jgi:hypothetical protein